MAARRRPALPAVAAVTVAVPSAVRLGQGDL